MEAPKPTYFVYIFGSSVQYQTQVGVAQNLQLQLQEIHEGTAAENVTVEQQAPRLVYYEHYQVEEVARNREREIMKGGQEFTHRLIASMNPNWLDLSDTLS